MADYLIDTNHLATIVTTEHPVNKRLHRQTRFGDTFAIAIPIVTEMLYGILTLPRAKENLQDWQKYSVMFTCYDIERSDAENAARLQATLRPQGHQLHTIDAWIAIIALRYDLTLLTTDGDFGAVDGLVTENWFT